MHLNSTITMVVLFINFRPSVHHQINIMEYRKKNLAGEYENNSLLIARIDCLIIKLLRGPLQNNGRRIHSSKTTTQS